MSAPTLLDPADLLDRPEYDHAELIDGTPREKPMGAESEYIASELQARLRNHCREHRLGRVFNSNTGYRCFSHQPGLVRKPDTSVVLAGRLPDDRVPRGTIPVAPDLAVEVVSPTDLYEDIETRVRDYRSAGVRLIWVISPDSRSVLVRRADRSVAELGEGDTLSGEDVVPGFACPVAELFT